MKLFIYGILPYIALTVFLAGTILRYVYFERNWTTKSSEFLSKSDIRYSNNIFHAGLIMAFGGHVIGLCIPESWTLSIGMTNEVYHFVSLAGGLPAAILIIIGYILLMKRRFTNPYLRANTSRMDIVLYILLGITLLTGCSSTVYNTVNHFDYRQFISPWFRSLWMLSPDIELMEHIPMIFKIHMVSWQLLAIVFPFTRLVHCLSFPFTYLHRSPIVYRKNK